MLLATLVGLGGCGEAPQGKPGQQFEQAREAVIRGEFVSAARQLESFVEQHHDHPLAGRATFLLAKSYLGQGELALSQRWFERTRDRFPQTEEAHKAKFKLAMIELLRDEPRRAFEQFRQLAQAADGPYTPEAAAWSRFLEAELGQPPAP